MSKRANINIYDQESTHDDYKWCIKNKQQDIQIVDAYARPLKFSGQNAFVITEGGVDYNCNENEHQSNQYCDKYWWISR